MSVAFAPANSGLRFRVFHNCFDPDRSYALVAVSDYADTAPARLWFVNDSGWLWAVDQRRCLCVQMAQGLGSRPLADGERRELPTDPPPSDFS